ncbi:MAG TPA: phage tail protein [Rhizobiales bacterium]|nr:phage tail protein [Hyphomicrobiales bacterium]
MVKTPKTRHARTQREPVTIDLGPDEVRRIDEAGAAADAAAAGEAEAGAAGAASAPQGADAVTAEPHAPDFVPEPTAAEAPEAAFAAASSGERVSTAKQEAPHFGRARPQDTAEQASAAMPKGVRSGRASALAAGLVGGIVALAGAGALQFAGLLPYPGASGIEDAAVTALRTEIEKLKQQVVGLGDGSAAAGVEELRKALGESNTTVGNLATTVATLSATVDGLSADLAALKGAVETGGAASGTDAGEAVAQIASRLDALEAAVAALRQDGGGAARDDLAQLTGRIDAVEKAVNAAGAQTVDAEGRIDALERSLADVAAKVEAQADQPRIALAIASAALKAALDRGGPFASEVETLAAVAPDLPELADLRALARDGVPSRADLLAAAPDAAIAMIAAERVVDENAGFFERLLASAESLIKVRPVGVVEGEGVDAIVARMEAALKAGDLVHALAEYDTLPEGPKAAGAAFADQIRLRQKAEGLVERALAGALKA